MVHTVYQRGKQTRKGLLNADINNYIAGVHKLKKDQHIAFKYALTIFLANFLIQQNLFLLSVLVSPNGSSLFHLLENLNRCMLHQIK